ncbi:MAG TPA: L7Ae/L30e/S12e/Gadd45 family ribosomal protein [Longimicrobiales bacterium]|nr:L7Ae/L30e/S12e/Gadd45 family ribosomal protein [Longimicrobiales bacterium]
MRGPEPALRLLGLAARAGAVEVGTERVREAVRRGRVRLVIVAGDASANSKAKVVPLVEARGVPYVEVFDRARLGEAVGRGAMSAVGVTDAEFAKRIRELLRAENG